MEVGPRDGLQNESAPIPTPVKIAFIDALTASGLSVIEATSFVNPKAVPQLADAGEVMNGITRAAATRYPVLVPNDKGLHRALDAGAREIALFTSATEEFARANVGTSIAGTFERFAPVVSAARERGIWVRGYVSVAFGCPYSRIVKPRQVVEVVERLTALDCDEICLADTIGSGSPEMVRCIVSAALEAIPIERLALHFHDTSGQALRNIDEGLEQGVRIFDSAAGGLGGCPFAPGAPGNLATESLLRHLHGLGMTTGVDLDRVASAVEVVKPYIPRLQPASA